MAKQPTHENILGKFYAYELIDPRSNTVFYVGKGTGDRVSHHVSEYKRNSKHQSNKHKIAKIQEILESGNEVVENIVEQFHTQEEALALETELIRYYGIDNLTNIMASGTVYNYQRYPFVGFVDAVKLAISMLARIADMRGRCEMSQFVYTGVLKEYENIKSKAKADFLAILNKELDTKWKGAKSCLV